MKKKGGLPDAQALIPHYEDGEPVRVGRFDGDAHTRLKALYSADRDDRVPIVWKKTTPFHAVLKFGGMIGTRRVVSFRWDDVLAEPHRAYYMAPIYLADLLKRAMFEDVRGAIVDGLWTLRRYYGTITLVHLPGGLEEDE